MTNVFALRPSSLCLALATLAACGSDPAPNDTLAATDTSGTPTSDDEASNSDSSTSSDSSTTGTSTSETTTTDSTESSSDSTASSDSTESSDSTDSSDSTETTDTGGAECLAELDNLYTIAEAARVAFLVEQAQAPLHRCPHPIGSLQGGASSITPDLQVVCDEGPGQRCMATEGDLGPGLYPTWQWLDNPVWSGLDFAILEPHCFHYDFELLNALDGYGECTFSVVAYTDFSQTTYTLAGVLDENGMVLEPIVVEP